MPTAQLEAHTHLDRGEVKNRTYLCHNLTRRLPLKDVSSWCTVKHARLVSNVHNAKPCHRRLVVTVKNECQTTRQTQWVPLLSCLPLSVRFALKSTSWLWHRWPHHAGLELVAHRHRRLCRCVHGLHAGSRRHHHHRGS